MLAILCVALFWRLGSRQQKAEKGPFKRMLVERKRRILNVSTLAIG